MPTAAKFLDQNYSRDTKKNAEHKTGHQKGFFYGLTLCRVISPL